MLLAACAVTACGGSSETARLKEESETGIPPLPPAEAERTINPNSLAAALSLAGRAAPPGNPYEHAIGCSVALSVLAATLEDLPALAGEAERDALRRARVVYDGRAATEGRRRDMTADALKSEIEARREQALDDPMPEVQRAAACLRELASA